MGTIEKSYTCSEVLLMKAKDVSKLVKKQIIDKRGRKKTVYVKRVEVSKNHGHKSDDHAKAVEAYKQKKKYMSKENARDYVEKHYGKGLGDYAYMHASTGKTDTSAAAKSDTPTSKDKLSDTVKNHSGDTNSTETRKAAEELVKNKKPKESFLSKNGDNVEVFSEHGDNVIIRRGGAKTPIVISKSSLKDLKDKTDGNIKKSNGIMPDTVFESRKALSKFM